MSITDELREIAAKTECANGRCEKLYRGDLEHIADRIDAEHERQCAESWMRGHDAWAAIDRSDEMAEHGWIRLPKDADGVPIRVGDVMEWPTTGETFEVVGIGDGTLFYIWTGASTKRHHHEPTVEDVLREMHAKLDEVTALYVGEAIDSDERDSDEARIFAEYASKLRLRGDAE